MDVNEALQRKIKSGNKYDKYFEKVSCKSSFVGKGNTTFGMQQMKQLAKEHQYQTAEIAKQLRKNTIQETVSSIYEFLYDHLQYQLDGYDQQLRSPACSWQQRKSGIDCKSYSVFASTILLNLGIKHYFRKIKQPAYNPGGWTHVYVIVPDGENYYVIDGTIHQNIEVPFIEKEDLLMESNLNYYALNAPNVATLQQNKVDDVEKLKGFTIALNALEKIGVSPEKTLQISQLVKNAYFKKDSFNFPFRLINEKTLLVDNTFIELPINNGLGITPVTTTVSGLDLSMFTNNTTSPSTAGSGITGALSTLAIDPTGTSAIISTITSILPIGDIMANVTNVFKYGLSSWGAATDPVKAQAEMEVYFKFLDGILTAVRTSTNAQAMEDNLNELERAARYYDEMFRASVDRRSWAGSTTAAFELMDELGTKFYQDTVVPLISSLKNAGYNISSTTTTSRFGDLDHIYQPQVASDNTTAEKNGTFTHKIYTILGVPQNSAVTPKDTNTQLPVQYNPDGTVKPQVNSNSNMGKILGYGGALALAGFLVVPMLNKKK